ncbi:MAG: amidohydrolase [Ardenticatenaceae bacterium]|nr:amidohydrolase [Ardenticatenaceae bacterium]
MKTAIINVNILTLDPARRVISDGCLVIEEDRIQAVGTRAELAAEVERTDRRIDGRAMVAMPGLVNAHTHSFQSLLRGLADGLDLVGFLKRVAYRVAPLMTTAETRLGAALSILEAIKTGTTCLIDNHSGNTGFSATDEIAQTFKESGLRGVVARGIRLPTPRARAWAVPEHVFQFTLAQEIEITRDLIRRWRSEANGRVRICPAPLTLFLATSEDLRVAKALADEYAVPLHIHVAEARSEVEATLQDYGCREVELLAQLGVLDQQFHVVHGVWLDEGELDLLAARGSHVIHCPTSNMSLGSGIAPVTEMLVRGVNVALASDGIGNYNHDMFSVMKTTALLQRAHALRADALSAEQVLEMATLGGARALGLEKEIGSLEPGKKADLILLDLRKPHHVPIYDLPKAIVFGATASDVDTVMVDGQIVMQGREVKTLDEHAIIAAVEAAGPELVARAQLN